MLSRFRSEEKALLERRCHGRLERRVEPRLQVAACQETESHRRRQVRQRPPPRQFQMHELQQQHRDRRCSELPLDGVFARAHEGLGKFAEPPGAMRIGPDHLAVRQRQHLRRAACRAYHGIPPVREWARRSDAAIMTERHRHPPPNRILLARSTSCLGHGRYYLQASMGRGRWQSKAS